MTIAAQPLLAVRRCREFTIRDAYSDSVGALLVNRAAARFILRSRSAGSKGLPAAVRLRPNLPRP